MKKMIIRSPKILHNYHNNQFGIKDLFHYFSSLPRLTQWFIVLRYLSCPFKKLIRFIPQKGSLLDVGCGFGLLSLLLAKQNPDRRILGIDLDSDRIQAAKQLSISFPNLQFQTETLDQLSSRRRFDVITIVDIIYLLPAKAKIILLQNAYRVLRKGGYLFIKINDRSWTFRFFLTWLQELITVKLLRKTASKYSSLYFEQPNEVEMWLIEIGFQIEKKVKLPTPSPFFHPHNLIIAVK